MLGDMATVCTRLEGNQPLWVLVGKDGTLLAARHASAGLVILSWTTRGELEGGVRELFDQAPLLFESHDPQQRTFSSLMRSAEWLGMRLRIDDYVVEELERVR